jgi:hypothetical protein
MQYDKPLSLSLQKEIKKRKLTLDADLHKALQVLRIKLLLCRCNIMKTKDYTTVVLWFSL